MVREVGSFCSAVCGRRTLVANLSFFFDAWLASCCNDFLDSGVIIGVAEGRASALPGGPGDPTSNHRNTVSLRSSIVPHAARPQLATIIRTSATRVQTRIRTQRLIVAE